MKLSEFNYQLPKHLIAKYPVEPRDSARLLVVDRKTKTFEDKVFTDIIDYLEEGDSLVVNKTKVFPAKLIGRKEKTGAKIEILLLRELNPEEHLWDVLVEPARKVRIGNKIYFGDNNEVYCEVIDNTTSRGRTLKFHYEGDFFKFVEKYGLVPLPPYIKRQPEEGDKEWYQTVYAEVIGSVAAPTAGLHFTTRLLKRIEKKGVKIVPIVLHIGIGTFRKIEVEDLSKHRMDSEYFEISQAYELKSACQISLSTVYVSQHLSFYHTLQLGLSQLPSIFILFLFLVFGDVVNMKDKIWKLFWQIYDVINHYPS